MAMQIGLALERMSAAIEALPGHSKYYCSGCQKYFNGIGAHARHRRRKACLSEAQMLDIGYVALTCILRQRVDGKMQRSLAVVWSLPEKQATQDVSTDEEAE